MNGAVVWSADYRPFGQADVTVNTVANNFRFPGQYWDQETGLHYNWHRYYEPGIGRYLRADPSHSVQAGGIGVPYLIPFLLDKPQELNAYAYVQNDPVNFIDPLGLWTFTYSAGGHIPTGPWPVSAGGTASSELVNPLDASGELVSRGVTPEATAGTWADVGASAGVGDLSGTGDQAGPTIGIGAGRYGGIQFTLRREFDQSRAWYDPLKYLDGLSVGLGLGLGLPVNVTSPVECP